MPEPGAGKPSGTVLAFDFGLQRVGVAVGEPELGTAHPLPVVAAQDSPGRLTAIERLVKEWNPAQLVVGRPLDEDGAPHELTRRAERFARQLNGRFHLPVALVDERYSSVEAESRVRAAYGSRRTASLSRGKALDSQAAQLVLEQYFNEQAA
ncbi:MAG: Holliday junction resolvase RuvX [Betaproteobacteria bacterium]|nr:Holliday junction resolvase RuvX [Betaproteobacteria bacterium]